MLIVSAAIFGSALALRAVDIPSAAERGSLLDADAECTVGGEDALNASGFEVEGPPRGSVGELSRGSGRPLCAFSGRSLCGAPGLLHAQVSSFVHFHGLAKLLITSRYALGVQS